jgi:hypothetical protein
MSLIIVSCAKHEASKIIDAKAVESIETEENYDYIGTTDDTMLNFKFNIDNSTNNEYQSLAITKLQEVSDLITLKQEHPEFKEDIETQLSALILKDTNLKFLDSNCSIENISQKGGIKRVSDSVQHRTLYFDIVAEKQTIKDSLNALIITKTVIIDGSSVKTNKIRFSKID